MNQCYLEDQFEYLMTIMLECPDAVTRLNIAILVKFMMQRLKIKERNILMENEVEQIEFVSQIDQSL